MLRRLAAAALAAAAIALSGAAPNPWPWGTPDTGPGRPLWPWGPFDASEPGLDSGLPDGGPTGPCAAQQARVDRRRAWPAARREEQFAKGGPPDPKRGVPNVVQVYCEFHPGDEDCALASVAIEVRLDEAVWNPDAGVDDYDAHVLVMKRALGECLARLGKPPGS